MAFVLSSAIVHSSLPTVRLCSRAPFSSSFARTRQSTLPHIASRTASSSIKMVAKEGSPAPDFSAVDTDGNAISISGLKGANVVLYFSNGSGPGCTAQSCAFRDAAEDFALLDAKIISVSAQSQGNTSSFRSANKLPFPVIADSDGKLQKLYGVPATLGLIPGRITYVIDKDGIVRKIYNSQFSTAQHIKVASETLSSLAK